MNRIRNALKLYKSSRKTKQIESVTGPIRNDVDLIGPADKVSNIRQYRFYKPASESKVEYDYRIMREKALNWNQEYWTQQNLNFIQSKKAFMNNINKSKLLEKKLNVMKTSDIESTTENNDSNEMNEFYRKFLNDNYQNHYAYNSKWFKLNLSMLIPAVRVHLYRFNKKLTQKA